MSFSEFDLIEKYSLPLTGGQPGAFDLKDDAALITSQEGFIVTTDMLIEGVHFLSDANPSLIAKKALRANLSDLAAMGSKPVAYTLAVAIPKKHMKDESWIKAFSDSLAEENASFGVYTLGGDTTSTDGLLTISITAFGVPVNGHILKRSEAYVGDSIFVSGSIGDAFLGLQNMNGSIDVSDNDRKFIESRYWMPTPRTELGQELAAFATSAIDISDGLLAEMNHVCKASSVGAVIQYHALPLSSSAKNILKKYPGLYKAFFSAGDDFELLFTVKAEDVSRCAELSQAYNIQLTKIGEVNSGVDLIVYDDDTRQVEFGEMGYDHFK